MRLRSVFYLSLVVAIGAAGASPVPSAGMTAGSTQQAGNGVKAILIYLEGELELENAWGHKIGVEPRKASDHFYEFAKQLASLIEDVNSAMRKGEISAKVGSEVTKDLYDAKAADYHAAQLINGLRGAPPALREATAEVGHATADKRRASDLLRSQPDVAPVASAIGSGTITTDSNTNDCGGTSATFTCYTVAVKGDSSVMGAFTIELPSGVKLGQYGCDPRYSISSPTPASWECTWSGTGKPPASATFHLSTAAPVPASESGTFHIVVGACPARCFFLSGP